MKKIVILISGKIKSGKNQLADFMKEYFEKQNLKVSSDYFAKAVKDGCKEDFKKLADELNNYVIELKRVIISKYNYINEILDSKIDELKISDENWYENKTFITRTILQLYGTEIFRNRVDSDYWVKQVKDKCENSDSDIILVTDTRFPNEITEMYSDNYDLITIRLLRDINKDKSKNHYSETALDDWNEWTYIIDNKRNSLKSFQKQVIMVAEDILKNKSENV
ncbi:MAG TPA: hypothetical protein PLI22_07595 [Caldisericia bacterium]|nr:hypothetical protein [Caldisericia bacterium]